MDPNTGFEFNLQLLASENGYQTTANGKEFLVRRVLEGDCCFSSTSSLHLYFLTDPQVNICSNVTKCGAGNAGCELEDGVPTSQVGMEKSLQYSTNGLLTLTYRGELNKTTGISTGAQHSSFCSRTSACIFKKCKFNKHRYVTELLQAELQPSLMQFFFFISNTGHFHH